ESTEGEADETERAEKKAAKPVAKTKAKETEVVELQSARDLFEFVKKEGSRGYDVQRYKGLGEMTAEQLWETTMDPERRTLLSVKLEDIAETETIFTTLMGEDVESRRKFIEEKALDVKNLEIGLGGAGARAREIFILSKVQSGGLIAALFSCSPMPRIALATSSKFPNLTADDRLLLQPLARRGIHAEPAIWD